MSAIPIAKTVADMQSRTSSWQTSNNKIALIPTMGALHEGHLAHLGHARKMADHVVVSIFVNPTQFAPHEDFDRYPRDIERDALKLQAAGGVDLIYAPELKEIYPQDEVTRPTLYGPALGLESDSRPHFFAGVVAVVEKLFRQVRPDFATFGEKDYQQLLVVKQLAQELDTGIQILPVPVVRETDGLALSSRNAYLSREERESAPALFNALQKIAARVISGREIAQAEAEGAAALLLAGFERVDYCVVRDAETLRPIRDFARPARILAAAWLGKTRLIDNVAA